MQLCLLMLEWLASLQLGRLDRAQLVQQVDERLLAWKQTKGSLNGCLTFFQNVFSPWFSYIYIYTWNNGRMSGHDWAGGLKVDQQLYGWRTDKRKSGWEQGWMKTMMRISMDQPATHQTWGNQQNPFSLQTLGAMQHNATLSNSLYQETSEWPTCIFPRQNSEQQRTATRRYLLLHEAVLQQQVPQRTSEFCRETIVFVHVQSSTHAEKNRCRFHTQLYLVWNVVLNHPEPVH